jgi:hypothetical protein
MPLRQADCACTLTPSRVAPMRWGKSDFDLGRLPEVVFNMPARIGPVGRYGERARQVALPRPLKTVAGTPARTKGPLARRTSSAMRCFGIARAAGGGIKPESLYEPGPPRQLDRRTSLAAWDRPIDDRAVHNGSGGAVFVHGSINLGRGRWLDGAQGGAAGGLCARLDQSEPGSMAELCTKRTQCAGPSSIGGEPLNPSVVHRSLDLYLPLRQAGQCDAVRAVEALGGDFATCRVGTSRAARLGDVRVPQGWTGIRPPRGVAKGGSGWAVSGRRWSPRWDQRLTSGRRRPCRRP